MLSLPQETFLPVDDDEDEAEDEDAEDIGVKPRAPELRLAALIFESANNNI